VRGRFPLRRMPPVRIRGKRDEASVWTVDRAAAEVA
jgi:hypothetical protein